ncbi:virion structural protein [Erwinia phage vB_EamM_ChrisDB]|uniref:virion structural protein n=1 Tax=Erwinia phage vB_EamM_ChrisDB TaxID=1883371 RepID=UPI00081C85E4|nr:virion structural protein [Erwinia phage vB_EamM_ChrisDB]ANZ48721.1 putative virion structural protein [Erwinia phage vB_EamM_ChrisDB]
MALYSLSQRQFLYDAINAENPGAIMPMELENANIGIPRAIAVTASGANTEITIRGRQGRGYVGAQTFRYKRLSLNDLFKNMTPQVTAPNAYGWLNVVSKRTAFAQNLNGRYGLNLVADDIPENYIYLNVLNTLRVNASCIQYTGTITFMSIRGKNSLEELVLNDILPELKHPIEPSKGKRSLGMLLYGEDFTDEVQVMAAFKNGRLDVGSNFDNGYTDNLMATLIARGLPAFDPTSATITRMKASDYQFANKMFDNVLVITNVINDPDVSGDCMLHYNN